MEHIWVCTCGHETECEPDDFRLGAVFKCPACRRIYGCVKPLGGGKAWVLISNETARLHHLVETT